MFTMYHVLQAQMMSGWNVFVSIIFGPVPVFVHLGTFWPTTSLEVVLSALKVVEPNLPNVKTSLENGDEDFPVQFLAEPRMFLSFFLGSQFHLQYPRHIRCQAQGRFEVHTFSAGPLRSPCPAQLHRRGGTKLTLQGNGSNIGSGNGPAKLEFQDLTIRYHPCSSLFLIHLSQLIIHLASISYHSLWYFLFWAILNWGFARWLQLTLCFSWCLETWEAFLQHINGFPGLA
jgi:uncharacterized membrane protein YqaE (UPF0057 family)